MGHFGVSARVRGAMAAVPRVRFLPATQRRRAGYDGPLPIGYGMTNSQPRTVAAMLELLDVARGHRVLDVGSGSGWTTALLAWLTGPTGSVLGLEVVPDLVTMGSANLAQLDLPWARIEQARADVLGSPADAPFDRVLVSAEADDVPSALLDQLGDPGVLVLPVRGRMVRVERSAGVMSSTTTGYFRFVPLITP